MADPVVGAYIATTQAGKNLVQSSFDTATCVVLSCWEARPRFGVQMSQVSADPIISLYRSNDGGVSFESQPSIQIAIPNKPSGFNSRVFPLPTGYWAVVFGSSGPSTQTWFMYTAEQVVGVN